MLYTSSQDFFDKASECLRLSRDEEKQCAVSMKNGSAEARQRIIDNYIPFVAACVKKYMGKKASLQFIYGCLQRLEIMVDKFDFLQGSEAFTHSLSLALRQEITKYIAGA